MEEGGWGFVCWNHLSLCPFMLAEHHPNCQSPHSLHKTTQTQIFVKLITVSISVYIMRVMFSDLNHRVCALEISIIIFSAVLKERSTASL